MIVDHLTGDPEVRKAWACPDAELQSMINLLPRIPLSERDAYKECIRLHRDYTESGLVNIPWEYQYELQKFDPYLRLRYDLQCQCYVIERVDTGLRAWVRLFRWADAETGEGKPLSVASVQEIIGKLKAADMRRFESPAEYLKYKRAKADAIRKANDDRNTDELLGVIDGMTKKQIDNFVAVEKAIASGERIDVRGDDARTMNMWHEIAKSGQGLPVSDMGEEI